MNMRILVRFQNFLEAFVFRVENFVLVDLKQAGLLNKSLQNFSELITNYNKTGTSQVGAISKAQNAQNIFLEKNLKFSNKFSFGKCRTVPKKVKRGPFLIDKHAFCSKITKNSKGDPLGTLQKFRKKKVVQCRKKSKGGTL